MFRFGFPVLLLVLMPACNSEVDGPVSLCELVHGGSISVPPEGVRISAVFVPNALHGAYFAHPDCPSDAFPTTFPEKQKLEEFFNAAYAGGGVATRLKVDATVTVVASAQGSDQGVVLQIEQVHEFTDVSVIRPPGSRAN